MGNDVIEFCYQSIADTQGTIRALDIKAGFLFLIVFQPILNINYMLNEIVSFYKHSSAWLFLIVPIVFAMVLSCYSLCMSVLGIKSPSRHVEHDLKKCLFSDFDLYDVPVWNALLCDKDISRPSLARRLSDIQSDKFDMVQELILEKMKLSYIRAVKMKRINICLFSTMVWGGLVCLVLALGKYCEISRC